MIAATGQRAGAAAGGNDTDDVLLTPRKGPRVTAVGRSYDAGRSRIESCRSMSVPPRAVSLREGAHSGTGPGWMNRWDSSPVLPVGDMPHLREVGGL